MNRVGLSCFILAWLLGLEDAFAQGTINFSDFVSGVVFSHVYGPQTNDPSIALVGNIPTPYSPSTPFGDWPTGTAIYNGSLLGGSATGPTNQLDFTNGFLYTAQLWAAPGDNNPENLLQPVLQYTTTLRTGPGTNSAGFIVPLSFTETNPDPGIPLAASGSATCQLRVWYNAGGAIANWSMAQSEAVLSGASPLFNVDHLPSGTNFALELPANLAGLQSFNLHLPSGTILPPTLDFLADTTAQTFTLFCAAVTNHLYQFEYKTNLAQANWLGLGGPISSTNGTALAVDGLTNSQRFYRVVILDP